MISKQQQKDEMKELTQSLGWELLSERLQHRKNARIGKLLVAQDLGDIRKCQGYVQAIDEFLSLPHLIIKEE